MGSLRSDYRFKGRRPVRVLKFLLLMPLIGVFGFIVEILLSLKALASYPLVFLYVSGCVLELNLKETPANETTDR